MTTILGEDGYHGGVHLGNVDQDLDLFLHMPWEPKTSGQMNRVAISNCLLYGMTMTCLMLRDRGRSIHFMHTMHLR